MNYRNNVDKALIIDLLNNNDSVTVIADGKVISKEEIQNNPSIYATAKVHLSQQAISTEVKVVVSGHCAEFMSENREQKLIGQVNFSQSGKIRIRKPVPKHTRCILRARGRKSSIAIGGPTKPPKPQKYQYSFTGIRNLALKNLKFVDKKG